MGRQECKSTSPWYFWPICAIKPWWTSSLLFLFHNLSGWNNWNRYDVGSGVCRRYRTGCDGWSGKRNRGSCIILLEWKVKYSWIFLAGKISLNDGVHLEQQDPDRIFKKLSIYFVPLDAHWTNITVLIIRKFALKFGSRLIIKQRLHTFCWNELLTSIDLAFT